MATTRFSRRAVFRRVAQTSYHDWPAYTATPLYDRSSTTGIAEDVRVLATVWFDHDAHESLEEFVTHWPLAYVEFHTHDRYAQSTTYEMDRLFRVFTAETRGFFWAGAVAIDTTEADPFTGDRTGHEEEIIGTKEETDEYAYQWRRSSSSVEQNGLSKPSCSRIFLTDSLENTYLNPVICRVVATSSRCDGVGVVGAAKRIAGHEDRGRAIAAGTPRVRSVGEIVVRYAIAGHTPAVGDTGRPGGHEAILFRLS